jgi:hypothetical protein
MRGGVERGRTPPSARSTGRGGGAIGRHGRGAAIGGREDDAAADVGPAKEIIRISSGAGETSIKNKVQRTEFKPTFDL